jgi:hypothetical protein
VHLLEPSDIAPTNPLDLALISNILQQVIFPNRSQLTDAALGVAAARRILRFDRDAVAAI